MNYGEIRTEFKSLLNRSDCTNALADTFLTLALQRCTRDLRTPPQETFATMTVDALWAGFPVPSTLMKVIAFLANDEAVKGVSITKFAADTSIGSGIPTIWARFGQTFQFKTTPAEGTVIDLYYHSEFPAFASDLDETVLSIIAPDLLIYGGLSYAADHFIDERADRFEGRYGSILASLIESSSTVDGDPDEVSPVHVLDGDY